MTPIQPPHPGGDFGEYDDGFEGETGRPGGRRRLVRYGAPVAVAGVAAATIGLGTALATTAGSPSLPHLTAGQLLTTMAKSKVQTVSGTVRITTDLGIPAGALGGAIPGAGAGAFGGPGHSGAAGASADPQTKLTELLSGTHTLRVAADGPQRQRISVLDSTSEYSVIHNGSQLWAYNSAANAVYHAAHPANAPHPKAASPRNPARALPATPQDAVQQALKAVDPTTSVTVDGTARVAGRDAYELVIAPKQADSTVGSIRVAVDAGNGVPLSFTLTPRGSGTAAVDIAYTSVDFGKPAASAFTFTVPKGAKVTEGTDSAGRMPGLGIPMDRSGALTLGSGWTSVLELKPGAAAPRNGPAANTPKTGAPMNGPTNGPKNGLMRGAGGAPGAQSLPSLMGSLGHQVHGAFGSGTVVNTRLVNILITGNGTVYAGAVTENGLIKAADSAAGK